MYITALFKQVVNEFYIALTSCPKEISTTIMSSLMYPITLLFYKVDSCRGWHFPQNCQRRSIKSRFIELRRTISVLYLCYYLCNGRMLIPKITIPEHILLLGEKRHDAQKTPYNKQLFHTNFI